jgi:large subunit ribosomal protein L2
MRNFKYDISPKLKKFKPITPSLRHKVAVDKSFLSKVFREKCLSINSKNHAGRNYTGRITCRHKGGRVKRSLRFIDLNYTNCYSKVNHSLSYEYDPNRSAFIVRTFNNTFKPFYVLSNDSNGTDREIQRLKDIIPGTNVYNINGFCRSAGTFATVVNHQDNKTRLRLPSRKVISVSNTDTFASIGKNSNQLHKLTKLGKAGANRWRGIRPTTRGCAQNPHDHPNGGKTRGGISRTKWGKIAKWIKTGS